jgi:hypothetical protein
VGKAKQMRQQRQQENRRRCLFCGRAKGDLIHSHDPNSRTVEDMTREHLFRESWREKLKCSIIPYNHPSAKREFVKYHVDGSPQSTKPEILFQVTAKWVCDYCNSGWLNNLDAAVEPWIFDPYDDSLKPDPVDLRLWAIKVAVLLSYHENKLIPQPEDIQAVYDGQDNAAWHIFVGHMGNPHHAYTFVGFGPIAPGGGRIMGITQASWSLGHLMFIAIRLVGDSEIPTNLFNMFRQSNISERVVIAEVQPKATRVPSAALLPKMDERGYMSWAWYFSTNSLSPISHKIRGLEEGFRQAAKNMGVPFRQL